MKERSTICEKISLSPSRLVARIHFNKKQLSNFVDALESIIFEMESDFYHDEKAYDYIEPLYKVLCVIVEEMEEE